MGTFSEGEDQREQALDSQTPPLPLVRPRVPEWADRRGRSPTDLSPVPGAAVARVETPGRAEETGTRPRRDAESGEHAHAEVVPLHPSQDERPSVRPDAIADNVPGEPVAPPRPPVLASEVLREDMEPSEPGGRGTRWAINVLGSLGLVVTLGLGGLHAAVVLVALLLGGTTVVSFLRHEYARRAGALLGLAASGTVVATGARIAEGAPLEAPVLALGTVVLAGGLLFRSWYRASSRARVVVAAGMAIVGVWFILAGGVDGFSYLEPAWQGFAPLFLRVGFALVLLLSLLAFMGANSTGGAQVWAGLLLGMYVAHVGVQVTILFVPVSGPAATVPSPIAATSLGAALFTIIGALSLAQTLAAASRPAPDPREPTA